MISLFILGISLTSAGQETDAVTQLKNSYQQAIDLVFDPIRKLESRYLEELEKLKLQKQQAGDLDSVLVVQQEIENFKAPDPERLKSVPELRKLRGIYDTSYQQLAEEYEKSQIDILVKVSAKFEALKTEMTKQGEIEIAKQASEPQKEVQEKIESLRASVSLSVEQRVAPGLLWSLTSKASFESVSDCEADREEGRWVLSNSKRNVSYIKSDKSFTPPFAAKVRAMTDTKEIRFFLNKRETVIFGWTSNPKQLRLASPTGGRPKGFQEKGFIEKKKMHDIEIRLTKDRLQAFANGELRGELIGDFSEIEGTMGIGPAMGSVVTVESFEVYQLPDK